MAETNTNQELTELEPKKEDAWLRHYLLDDKETKELNKFKLEEMENGKMETDPNKLAEIAAWNARITWLIELVRVEKMELYRVVMTYKDRHKKVHSGRNKIHIHYRREQTGGEENMGILHLKVNIVDTVTKIEKVELYQHHLNKTNIEWVRLAVKAQLLYAAEIIQGKTRDVLVTGAKTHVSHKQPSSDMWSKHYLLDGPELCPADIKEECKIRRKAINGVKDPDKRAEISAWIARLTWLINVVVKDRNRIDLYKAVKKDLKLHKTENTLQYKLEYKETKHETWKLVSVILKVERWDEDIKKLVSKEYVHKTNDNVDIENAIKAQVILSKILENKEIRRKQKEKEDAARAAQKKKGNGPT